mmetsp:Transcript_31950/g.63322  ORF Transcript_31950/g.63322 Transcript_31950/m.63322 type:complete len:87 (+) Transcript_31950:826-1086(+)
MGEEGRGVGTSVGLGLSLEVVWVILMPPPLKKRWKEGHENVGATERAECQIGHACFFVFWCPSSLDAGAFEGGKAQFFFLRMSLHL